MCRVRWRSAAARRCPVRFGPQIVHAATREVFGRCPLCNGPPGIGTLEVVQQDDLHAAHILDQELGGPAVLWNALGLCPECNLARTRAPYPKLLSLEESNTRSQLWYAEGYSAVAAKVLLYGLVDAIRSWSLEHPNIKNCEDFRVRISVYYARVSWAFMDFNFHTAAGTALGYAEAMADGLSRDEIREIRQQQLCRLVDRGDFETATEFDDAYVQSEQMSRRDPGLYATRLAWRTGLRDAYFKRTDHASGLLKDVATDIAQKPSEYRHRVEIVRSWIDLQRPRDRDDAISRVRRMVVEAAGDARRPPCRPQTCDRIVWLAAQLPDRPNDAQALALERLERMARSFPIRQFNLPSADSSSGIEDCTRQLRIDRIYEGRHPSADGTLEHHAVDLLGKIGGVAQRVNQGEGLA